MVDMKTLEEESKGPTTKNFNPFAASVDELVLEAAKAYNYAAGIYSMGGSSKSEGFALASYYMSLALYKQIQETGKEKEYEHHNETGV
jgi:hypothetical protein